MTINKSIYTYVYHFEEASLCALEQRAFFGTSSSENYIISTVSIDPSRSPFMRDRLDVLAEASTLEELENHLKQLPVDVNTFKVLCLNDIELGGNAKIPHPERRKIERQISLCIDAEGELDNPDIIFAIIQLGGIWYFGSYTKSISVWRTHVQKPHSYSTALSTRVARAVANIAAPKPENVRVMDPCCGIGTVVVEALSMGIDIVGRDMNPFVCKGSRTNIAHFGYDTTITLGPIQEVEGHYDVVIIDLPYNLFTHSTREEQFDIIRHARRIADKVVVVTIENIDDLLEEVNLTVVDRGIAKKQAFEREILVCV